MLGAAMLFSSGNFEVEHQSSRKHVEFSVKVPDLRKAVKLIRGNLGMKEPEMLLILVDELGKFGNTLKLSSKEKTIMQGGILRRAMLLMDEAAQR